MECVTAIGSSAVVEIAKSMTKPIKRQIDYKRNIEDLKNGNDKLANKMVEAQRFMYDGDTRFKEVGPSVSKWFEDSKKLNQQVKDLLEVNNTYLDGRHRSPWSRYCLSRKASKMAENVNKLLNEVPFSDVVLDVQLPKLGTTINLTGMMDFDSRRPLVDEILEALKDDNLSMISICGLGGVGKTTIAKMLVKAVESENHLVSLTSFSQNPDFNRIRSEIASDLGWRFSPDDSERDRRKILHKKLMECDKKILLIYDDVWEECNNEIGLPSPTDIKECKIVLTSRFEAVCDAMGSQKNFRIAALRDGEAWDLFREMVGDTADSSDLHQTAREIVGQCGGLPIAIKIIAGTLKGKRKNIWEDALEQLKNAKWKKIPGMEKDVINLIKASYNLQQDEARSCFLLCCLFPEDFDIPVASLVRCGMSLKLFEDSDNLKNASNRVEALICGLKQSFLLLDGDSREYESVKMHDVVRDVAISIASEDRCEYAVLHGAAMQKWPATNCTAISLVCKEMKERPVDLVYPKLQLLLLECINYSKVLQDNFFEGMKDLKVLFLNISGSLPKSLYLLENLRTLCINIGLRSRDISLIGALTNLEFLEILCYSSAELPKEIARLGNLRVLDLKRQYIPVGVLSHLTKLEELHIHLNFRDEVDREKTIASLKELKSLPVTTLVAWVPDPSIFHEPSNFGNISRFQIFVANVPNWHKIFGYISEKKLCLNGYDISNIKGNVICALLGKTECLILQKIQNLKTLVPDLRDKCFQWLKILVIEGCAELEYIVDARMEQIPHIGFPQLEKLELKELSKLKYVFPLSTVRGMRQLQSISIKSCKAMEGIWCRKEVDDEKITGDEIEFSNLTDLTLSALPNLTGLCVEMDTTTAPTTAHHMEKSEETGISHEIQQINSISRSGDQMEMISFMLFPSPWLRFYSLQNLFLDSCDRLKVAFSPFVAEELVQLKTLHINGCRKMEYIVGREEEEEMPTQRRLFPSLQNLYLKRCERLKVAFSPSVAEQLVKLKTLHISYCGKMEYIVGREEDEKPTQRRVFPMLRYIRLISLRDLVACCGDSSNVLLDCWDSLEQIAIEFCPEIKSSPLIEKAIERASTLNQNSIDESNNEAMIGRPTPRALIRKCRRRDTHQKSHPRDNPAIETQHQIDSLKHKEILFKIPPHFIRCLDVQQLEVMKCDNLTFLFSPHVAKLFVKLETISVKLCGEIKEIVGEVNEESRLDKVVLPQLRFIRLIDLHNLTSFYNGISAMELPSLEVVKVNGCGQMKTFSYGSLLSTPKLKKVDINTNKYSIMEDLNASVKEVMETTLHIYKMEDLVRIRHDHQLLEDENLSKFLAFHIEYCPQLVNAIPFNLMPSLQNLEKLIVQQCESLEVVFQYEGMNNCEGTLSHLQEIQLKYLNNLKHIFNKIPKEIVGFQNLRILRVYGCHNLRNIFSVSVASWMLQLQELQVKWCRKLKKIVVKEDKEEEEESIVLPQLRFISLIDLHNLRSFYNGISDMELPSLEVVEVDRCSQMKTFSYGSFLSTTKLNDIYINKSKYSIMEDLNVTVKEVEEVMGTTLHIYKMEDLVRIGHDHQLLEDEDLSKFLALQIEYCPKLLNAIPCNLMPSLQNLEKLIVQSCKSLEEIFQYEGVNNCEGTFSHLQEIQLKYLNNLKHIFNKIPKELAGFQNLRDLRVYGCHNLRNIFSVSVASWMLQLQELQVNWCIVLKEIVAKDEKEEEEESIVLPQLRFIRLIDLHNLRSFYNGIVAMELPSLKVVKVDRCSQMKTFSNGSLLSTPKLKKVDVNRIKYSIMEDINITVKKVMGTTLHIYKMEDLVRIGHDHQLLEDEDLSKFLALQIEYCPKLLNAIPCNLMPSLQNLEKLIVQSCKSLEEIFEYEGVNNCERTFSHLQDIQLKYLNNLKHIFNKIPKEFVGFQNLRNLRVYGCHNLRNIFSVSVASWMLQLQELQVKSCGKLKEIVAKGEKEEEEESIVFPQLWHIEIEDCPNLECFYSGIYALQFPLLESLSFLFLIGLKTFSNGLVVKSPNLLEVTINHQQHPLKGDLNATLIGLTRRERRKEKIQKKLIGNCWVSPPDKPKADPLPIPSTVDYLNPDASFIGDTSWQIDASTNITWASQVSGSFTSENNQTSHTIVHNAAKNLRVFTYAQLKTATHNFRRDMVVGRGGFGKVYEGGLKEKLPSRGIKKLMPSRGTKKLIFAVKQLDRSSKQGQREWLAEVNILGCLSHLHLVKLLGNCMEHDNFFLVYDFMKNGSLHYHIFGSKSCCCCLYPTKQNKNC